MKILIATNSYDSNEVKKISEITDEIKEFSFVETLDIKEFSDPIFEKLQIRTTPTIILFAENLEETLEKNLDTGKYELTSRIERINDLIMEQVSPEQYKNMNEQRIEHEVNKRLESIIQQEKEKIYKELVQSNEITDEKLSLIMEMMLEE